MVLTDVERQTVGSYQVELAPKLVLSFVAGSG